MSLFRCFFILIRDYFVCFLRIGVFVRISRGFVVKMCYDLNVTFSENLASNNASTGKRSLSEDSQDGVATKKMRLSESPTKDGNKKLASDSKANTLTSFVSFMRSKIFKNQLSKSDLEQLCLQKICEVVMHKTELGDLLQTVRKQEQTIESLRKDMQQLTKQTKDLEIVNKKLMNELKGQNGKQKPLVPLKITRSVGLQVKLSLGNEQARKRGPNTPNRTTPSGAASNTTPVNNRSRTIAQNNTVVRQVGAYIPLLIFFLIVFPLGRFRGCIATQTSGNAFYAQHDADPFSSTPNSGKSRDSN